jgi:hypothetical protein
MTCQLSESLEELEAKREILRTLLKGLNLDISKRKLELRELLERWEVLDKEFRVLDRMIADQTKVKIIPSKYAPRDPKVMTAKSAQEMLALLGIPAEPESDYEEPEPETYEPIDEGDIDMLQALIELETN